jgi:hypothetical protein
MRGSQGWWKEHGPQSELSCHVDEFRQWQGTPHDLRPCSCWSSTEEIGPAVIVRGFDKGVRHSYDSCQPCWTSGVHSVTFILSTIFEKPRSPLSDKTN